MKVYGPYMTYSSSKPRQFVIVYYDDGTRESMSYARWLWEDALCVTLSSDWEVDHIDRDPLNNDWSNLRLLLSEDHRKTASLPATMVTITCALCGEKAIKKKRYVDANRRKGKAGPYCSRRCAGKAHH